MKQRFVTSITSKKSFTQTWVDFEQNVIEAAIDQWRDRLRSYVHAGDAHSEHML